MAALEVKNNMLIAAWTAQLISLILVLLTLLILGTGLFCFEDQLFTTALQHPTVLAPDCYVNIAGFLYPNEYLNSKLWLLSNLVTAITLSIIAQVTAVGFFKGSVWVKIWTYYGLLALIAFLITIGSMSSTNNLLACVILSCLIVAVFVFFKRSAKNL